MSIKTDNSRPVTTVAMVNPGGGVPEVKLSGSNAAGESDVTGTGAGSAVFDDAVRFVDVWNGGTGNLTISAGGIARVVPPGGRLVEFPEASTTFTIDADGSWVATAMS